MFQSLKNIGQSLSATTESILFTRDAKVARIRTLMVGTMLVGAFTLCTTNAAYAVGGTDLKGYATDVSTKTNVIPDIVSYISYLGGAVLAALGIVDLKKHVENPSQTPMKNGIAKLGFGGALLALPFFTELMQNTTGDGSQAASFQKFTNKPAI
ncbi:MAG TPA: hypothetical protein VIN59_07370 [Alphaproteobacteria bacterium]